MLLWGLIHVERQTMEKRVPDINRYDKLNGSAAMEDIRRIIKDRDISISVSDDGRFGQIFHNPTHRSLVFDGRSRHKPSYIRYMLDKLINSL